MAAKLQGQAKLMERLPLPERKGRELGECLGETAESDSIERIRRIEGEFALMYWRAWHGVPVRFAARDAERVPEHWLTFGQRCSLLPKPSPPGGWNRPSSAPAQPEQAFVDSFACETNRLKVRVSKERTHSQESILTSCQQALAR